MDDAVLFIEELDEKAREKVLYNIRKSQYVLDPELFKKLNDEIWEFRTLFKKTSYRVFAFWDKADQANTLVIATHGIVKKTNKTPKQALEKAQQLRTEYFSNQEDT